MDTQKINAHHHGNLAQALIDAGIELLNEGGLKALSLRKCAARAGVSHAAPAHHFEGLSGLTLAIRQRGFSLFAQSMQDKIDACEGDPFAKLIAMCEGYLIFFQQHTALANIMFNCEFSPSKNQKNNRESNKAFQILVNTCKPFKSGKSEPRAIQYAVWSMIQGYSSLVLFKEIKKEGIEENSAITIEDMLGMLNLELDQQYIDTRAKN